ncbi:MAG: PEGA domain-containing protein, partial [Caldisericia bacterium]|nr:PEGA domain-containing protein [Caldisericia bacterium]
MLIFLLLSIIFVNCNKINEKEIEINSNPSNAKLYIDTKYFGETPVRITLNIGEHIIELEKENFKVLKRKINISILSKKKYLYNLEKIPIIYSKSLDTNNIDLIKSYNNYLYLKADNSNIYKLDLYSGEVLDKRDLKVINIDELNCKEEETDKDLIKFSRNRSYTPNDIINLFLNIKTYLLKSNCQKIFEKRVKDVENILNLIIFNNELTEKL